jgi:hypothetical protein
LRPASGTRRSSMSYGALHPSHSTLNMRAPLSLIFFYQGYALKCPTFLSVYGQAARLCLVDRPSGASPLGSKLYGRDASAVERPFPYGGNGGAASTVTVEPARTRARRSIDMQLQPHWLFPAKNYVCYSAPWECRAPSS